MPDKHLREFTLSGFSERRSCLAVNTESLIDVEAGLHTFCGEKLYFEDKEVAYFSSLDTITPEPYRQWRWYLKPFLSYHATSPAACHFDFSELEAKIGKNIIGIINQNIFWIHISTGNQKVLKSTVAFGK